MYIAEENLKPIVYGFVNDDYESEFGLLRGHYIGDSAECEAECLRVQQEMEDWDDDQSMLGELIIRLISSLFLKNFLRNHKRQ